MKRVVMENLRAHNHRHAAPKISLQFRDTHDYIKVSINNAIPESGAEVSVGGLVVLNALGVYENQISDPTFYLVMVDKSYPHFFQ